MEFIESDIVELKETVIPDIPKEVVAFANSRGGTIYIGVNKQGIPVGVRDTDDTILQVKNMIRDSVKPDVMMFVRFFVLTENGCNIIAVEVQRGTDKPYYLAQKGLRPSGVYVRNGSSSDPSTDTAIRKMIKETDGDSFESMRSLEQDLTFEAAKKEFMNCKLEFGTPQMKTLGIINADGIYTNVGLLLSDQCPHTLKTATFQGTDQTEFKDRREFGGSLFRQMVEVYDYIDLRNQTHSTFDKLRRIDVRDYPEFAVREALLNSLVHRDYSFAASTLISVYDDRIEFTSIGGLLPGVSKNDIMLGLSVCRNPKLAGVFYRLHLIEAYGTGMPRIMKAYESAEVSPKIEVTDNAFKIILPNINYKSQPSSHKPEQQTLTSNEEAVISYLEKKDFITRKYAEQLLGISQSTANRLLKKMSQNGLLKQVGNGKTTKYYSVSR